MNWFFMLCRRQIDRNFKRAYNQVVKLEPGIFADFCDPKSQSHVEMQDHYKLTVKVAECSDPKNFESVLKTTTQSAK
jgi:hypothetical protein